MYSLLDDEKVELHVYVVLPIEGRGLELTLNIIIIIIIIIIIVIIIIYYYYYNIVRKHLLVQR